MMRRRFLWLGVVLAGIAVAGLAPPARADFQIRYSLDGGATFSAPISDNGPGDNNAKTGRINIDVDGLFIQATVIGGTSAALTTVDLQVQSSGVDDSGNTSPGFSKGIVVQASMDGLLTAPPPQQLTNRFADTTIPTLATTPTAETWISQDGANTFVTSGGTIKLDTGALLPQAPKSTTFTFSATPTYSITSQISIGAFGAGTALGLDSNDHIVTPAPAAAMLALSGLPLLGFGAWVRRRRMPVTA